MPTQLEKISEGLAMMAPAMGGLGAGLQGNLPQFQQVQQRRQAMDAEQQALDQQAAVQRMQTLYQDAATALPMAKRGDYEQLIKLGINRLQLLQNYPDADPSDTQRITQLAIAAKNGSEEAAELLVGELSSAVQVGMDLGVLERPEAPMPQSPEGKQAFDRMAGYLTQEEYEDIAAGRKPTRETETDENGYLRFVDTGERVFPQVEMVEERLSGLDRVEAARDLRAEINKENADFTDIANSWDRIAASAAEPSAAGDLALIFNFMKMLDPGSTVREGEFANAQNAASIPTRIRALYNRVSTGERLTQEQRADFFGQAENIFKSSKERANQITDEYVRIGRDLGLDREEIVVDRGADPDISAAMESLNSEGLPVVKNDQDYQNIPPGTDYIMDGVRYTKRAQ